jgi:hypothetical protein
MAALAKFKKGESTSIIIKRADKEIKLEVTF